MAGVVSETARGGSSTRPRTGSVKDFTHYGDDTEHRYRTLHRASQRIETETAVCCFRYARTHAGILAICGDSVLRAIPKIPSLREIQDGPSRIRNHASCGPTASGSRQFGRTGEILARLDKGQQRSVQGGR